MIIRLQEALKKERNNSNHASEKGPRLSLSVVSNAMHAYVEMCRKYIIEAIDND